MKKHVIIRFSFLLAACFFASDGMGQDSSKVFKPIPIVEAFPVPIRIAHFENASPKYYLSSEVLQKLGARDIGDAMKFVPGTQIKDYGGVGGVKTVAFRSLGAAHTGVSLDNNLILNNQIGSINLSSFEAFGMRGIGFSTGQPSSWFSMASAYIPANMLAINSELLAKDTSLNLSLFQRVSTVNAHESGLMLSGKIGYHLTAGGQIFARYGNGQYDYTYDLTGSDSVFQRSNANILNYKGRFNLSGHWKNGRINAFYYHQKNEQELPGAVILFNPSNDQKIMNEDNRLDIDFSQISDGWAIRANGYLHNNYTRYEDPTYLNNQGFISSSYWQSTAGGGIIANKINVIKWDRLFFGADVIYGQLKSNEFDNEPQRFQFNSVLGGVYHLGADNSERWLFEANLSHQLILDRARSGDSLLDKTYSRLSPYLGVSVKTFLKSDFRLRTFYKRAFRMPSFNDLYYNFIGNTNLRPEDAHLVNFGINWKNRDTYDRNKPQRLFIEAGVDAYLNYVSDKIVAVPTKDLFNWSMQNIGRTRAVGFDASLTFVQIFKKDWQQNVTASFSLNQSVDVTDETSPSFGHQIPYTPLLNATASYGISFKGYKLDLNVLYTGERYSLNENIPLNYLDPFVDFNLGLSKVWTFSDVNELSVSLKMMNVLNNNYEIIRSFPMPGRFYQMTLIYSYK